MAIDTNLRFYLDTNYTNPLDLLTAYAPHNVTYTHKLTTGNGINQAQHAWSDQRVLGSGATETLDMSGLLTNAFGATLAFTFIRLILVTTTATSVGTLYIGPNSSNGLLTPWSGNTADRDRIPPGGLLVKYAPIGGYAVTAGSGDLVFVTAVGGSVTYNITIISI